MTGPGAMGKLLVVTGLVLVAAGVVLILADRVPGLRLGRLPGDISIQRGSFRLYFPLATSIVLSLLLSLILWLVSRRR